MENRITPEQCRMARAALKWDTRKLAAEASVGVNTVSRFELGKIPKDDILETLRKTFEKQGIKFTDKGCVCFSTKKSAAKGK
jgi:transcriptional regulator with XRE-family HTH domain